MAQPDYAAMHMAVVEGDIDTARRLALELVASGAELLPAIENGFAAGVRRVGELWDEGEYFLPELVQGAEAMKAAMEVIRPALEAAHQQQSTKGRVVIGTVEGDMHDIGKGLVAVLLSANGFDVYDLGASVSIEAFLAKAAEVDADIVAASALLTTTMEVQARLVDAVRTAGGRTRRVLLGGAPTSRAWAERLGAAHAENALHAVEVAEELMR
jgi:trimethylamine corrinoid protein